MTPNPEPLDADTLAALERIKVKARAADLFNQCVIRKSRKGWFEINCALGFWGVSAPDAKAAEREAMHYWQQYYDDGEYYAYLSQGSHPTETVQARLPHKND